MGRSSILIVCRGNIARSPFAEAVINSELRKRKLNKKFRVFSRGVQGTMVDPQPVKFPNITFYEELFAETKPALDELNVDLSTHVSRPIKREDAESASVILAVDQKTQEGLFSLFPDLKERIHLLSELVDDKAGFDDPAEITGSEKHFKVFQGIKETIVKGFPKLLKLVND